MDLDCSTTTLQFSKLASMEELADKLEGHGMGQSLSPEVCEDGHKKQSEIKY